MNDYLINSGGTLSPRNMNLVLENPWAWAREAAYELRVADLTSDGECRRLMPKFQGWAPAVTPDEFRERARPLQDVIRAGPVPPPVPRFRPLLEELVQVKPLIREGRQTHSHRDGISLLAQVFLEKAGAPDGPGFLYERACEVCGRQMPAYHPSGRRVRSDRRTCSERCSKRSQRAQP